MNPCTAHRSSARRIVRASAPVLLILVFISLLALAATTGAADSTVSTESELIDAINAANNAGPGTYTIALAADITLTQNLPAFDNDRASAILLAGANYTIGCGTALDTVFTVDVGTTVEMQQVKVADCTVHISPILNQGALSLGGVTLERNEHTGGALHNAQTGILSIVASAITRNTAPAGTVAAGLYNAGSLEIEDSTISANEIQFAYGGREPAGTGGLRNDGTAVLREVVISDNLGSAIGGGITNTGNITVEESVIADNTTSIAGGGIYNEGSLTMTGGRISGNGADESAGGLYNLRGAQAVLANVEIVGNGWGGNFSVLEDAGAILNAGNLELTGVTLSGSYAWRDGGGLWAGGTVIIRRSSIIRNTTDHDGAGVYVPPEGSLTMYNSTVSGNNSARAIASDGVVNLQHVTMSNNEWGDLSSRTLNMSNSILETCTSSNPLGVNAGNLVANGGCGATYQGNTLLAPLALNAPGSTETHALLEGSPAIDRGDPAYCLNHDQRGVARPIGTGCDIGAFESEFSVQRQELLKNGEFDDGLNFWQKYPTHTWVQVKDGGDNFIATWPWQGYTFWQEGLAVNSGQAYTACAELMTTTAYPYQVNLRLTDGGTIIGLDQSLEKGYHCFDFTASKTTSNARFELYYVLINTAGTRLDFDSLSLNTPVTAPAPPTNTPTATATSTGEPPTPTNTPTSTPTDTPPAGAELVGNGEFDDGLNFWQKYPTHTWVQVKDGGDNFIATWPWKGYTFWQDGIAVTGGKSYKACAELMTTTTNPYQVNLRLTDGGTIIGLDRPLVKGSNCFTFTATKSTSSAHLELYYVLINTPGTRLDFDSISLKSEDGGVPPTATNTPTATPTGEPPTATPTATATNTLSPSAELLLNGGFDDNFLYWSKAPAHDWVFVRRSGDNKYIATYPWNGYKVYQSGLNIAGGQGYTACAELFTDTTYSYQVNLRLTNGTDVIGLDQQLAEGSNCFSFTATQSTGSGQLELYFSSLRTGGTLLNFDDLSLTQN